MFGAFSPGRLILGVSNPLSWGKGCHLSRSTVHRAAATCEQRGFCGVDRGVFNEDLSGSELTFIQNGKRGPSPLVFGQSPESRQKT